MVDVLAVVQKTRASLSVAILLSKPGMRPEFSIRFKAYRFESRLTKCTSPNAPLPIKHKFSNSSRAGLCRVKLHSPSSHSFTFFSLSLSFIQIFKSCSNNRRLSILAFISPSEEDILFLFDVLLLLVAVVLLLLLGVVAVAGCCVARC